MLCFRSVQHYSTVACLFYSPLNIFGLRVCRIEFCVKIGTGRIKTVFVCGVARTCVLLLCSSTGLKKKISTLLQDAENENVFNIWLQHYCSLLKKYSS